MPKKRRRLVQSISVSPELKARMDKVEEPVNWSALACQAFEARLNEIAKQKETRDMSDVIERLRASKQEATSAEYDEGFKSGQEWAKTTAEYAELRRLGEYKEGASQYWDAIFSAVAQSSWSTGECLYFEIQPNDEGDTGAAESFWDMVAGPDTQLTDDFLKGFAEGALDVWREVEDKL